MKIVALIKSVPDTETKIKINGDASDIDETGVKFVINPFDEYAIEEAIKIREAKGGDTTVTVISMGPERVAEGLRTALAMGADDAIQVTDAAFDGGDAQTTGRVLAEVIKPLGADLILGGKQGIDHDSAQTCAAIAEYLDIPQALIVTDLTISDDGGSATARRKIEGGEEVIEMTLPALVTCEKGLNEPRYASLPGIMKAKKKEIKKVTLADLSLSADQVGSSGAQSTLVRYLPLEDRPPVKMIDGGPAEQAKELVRLLREEAKVV